VSVAAARWAKLRLAAEPAPRDGGLSHLARAVLLSLAIDANVSSGLAFTSADTIAAELGQHCNRIKEALNELRAWPHLPVEVRRGKSAVWTFTTNADELSTPAPPAVPPTLSTPAPPAVSTGTAGGATPAPPAVPEGLLRDVEGAPRPAPAATGRGVGVPLTGSLDASQVRAILEREVARERARLAGEAQ
jgi:hypothetical protein